MTLLILKTNNVDVEVELTVTENAMAILVHTLSAYELNLNLDSGELVLIRLISDRSCS